MKVYWYLEWTLLASSLLLITLEISEAAGFISAPKIDVIDELYEFYNHCKDVITSEHELETSAQIERKLRIEWLRRIIHEEQAYISQRCATGKLDYSVCNDPMEIGFDESLQLLHSDTHFRKHVEEYNLLDVRFKGGPDEALQNADKADKLKKSWHNLNAVSWRLFWHIYRFVTFGILVTIQVKSTFFNGSSRSYPSYPIVYMSTLTTYSLYFASLWIFGGAENQAQIIVYFWMFAVIFNLKYIFSSTTEEERMDPNIIFKLCSSGNQKDRETLMKMLSNQTLTSNIDINSRQKGKSALHLAVEKNHFTIVQDLIRTFGDKIDLSTCNRDGHTALDLAVISKNVKILKILLEIPSKIATTILTPSMVIALKNDNTKIIQILMPKLQESMKNTFQRICDILIVLKRKDVPNRKKLTSELESLKNRAINDLTKENLPTEMSNVNGEEESCSDHECPICDEPLIFPRKIFACRQDHLICNQCLEKLPGSSCPSRCNQDFIKDPPKRRLDYESLVILKRKTKV